MATETERAAVRKLLQPLRSPCIVELGARGGEEEFWFRGACGETPHHVMVEPDIVNAQMIIDGGIHENRRLIIGAVSDRCGFATFHGSITATDVRGSGSILEPSGHTSLIADVMFPVGMRTVVPTYSLNAIFEREWLTKIDLLWADVQGAEAKMIGGGHEALRHTRYLFMEVENVELYRGQALRPVLLGMLPGWELIGDFGENVLLSNPRFEERAPR